MRSASGRRDRPSGGVERSDDMRFISEPWKALRTRRPKLLLALVALVVAVAGAPAAAQSHLQIGQEVPNFTLVNQDSRNVSLNDFRGRGVVISFLYTRCPFPDQCPMIAKKLKDLASLMDRIEKGDRIQVLAITLDPAHDKPEVLKAYAQGMDETRTNWHFLTGTEDSIARVAGAFGVLYWDEKGLIEHNMRTGFIDPNGRLQVLMSGADWKAGQFAARIKPHLE